jgi:hypothetical protein
MYGIMNTNEKLETLYSLRCLLADLNTANQLHCTDDVEFSAVCMALEKFASLIRKAELVYAW